MKKNMLNLLGLTMGGVLVFSSLVLVQPVSGATCRTSCGGGQSCSCTGSQCTQLEGTGCATFNSHGEITSSCECNPS